MLETTRVVGLKLMSLLSENPLATIDSVVCNVCAASRAVGKVLVPICVASLELATLVTVNHL